MTATATAQQASKYPRGSVWRKWDLHLHTPASFDYHDKSVSNEALIQALKKASIAAAVICDHHVMDIARISALRTLAGDEIVIFPGIELRTELGGKESVHLVGIFSDTADLDHVWTTLRGKLGLTMAHVKENGDERIYVDFKEAATTIRDLGGLVSVHAGRKSNSIESISNAEAFKRAVKEDLARECIDIMEVGTTQDVADYETKVFPAIKKVYPLVIGSDSHDAKTYALKLPMWVRSDPTFEGLRQILHEPKDRILFGDTPPLLQRVSENKTKYIAEVSIHKIPDVKFGEAWFDCMTPFNPGLVAIIGNKGSGKSALSETIGLLGDTHNAASFSFLSDDKFRQPKNNKARYFTASLTWESGAGPEKCLASDVDPAAVETVKYIPQNFLEKICNELRGGTEGQFDAQLKGVIFSHVGHAERLGTESLDELIEYKTKETDDAIALLRTELNAITEEIVNLENMNASAYRQALEAERNEKQRELESHDAAKPAPMKEPETDPDKQAAMAGLTKAIDEGQAKLSNLIKERKGLEDEKIAVARRAATAVKLSAKVENFRKQYQSFQAESKAEFAQLGIDIDAVVNLSIDTGLLQAAEKEANARTDVIAGELNPEIAGNLASRIVAQESLLAQRKAELDAPNRQYQDYLTTLEQWQTKRDGILGSTEIVGSLAHIDSRLNALASVPERLQAAAANREAKSKEIFSKIESLAASYRALYKPVQDFIERHPLAKEGFTLDFRVNIIDAGFEEGFFRAVSQQKKGSFNGVEEGRQALKALLAATDWNSSDGLFKFLEDIVNRLNRDYRQPKRPSVSLKDQLRKESSVASLYNYLFSLDYLKPKYNLQWAGRDIEELSPGERGTVLLLFYLLVDNSTIPLVIDQPEENLDNQTVYHVLVPAIKEARSRRQIVIVTHNPNLAVVCDADQVICAHIDKKDGNRVTYEYGSIEDPVMNRRIIDILEGTRPAFDNRDSKYQDRPSLP